MRDFVDLLAYRQELFLALQGLVEDLMIHTEPHVWHQLKQKPLASVSVKYPARSFCGLEEAASESPHHHQPYMERPQRSGCPSIARAEPGAPKPRPTLHLHLVVPEDGQLLVQRACHLVWAPF
jgi:hypothetical protein